MTDQPAPPTPTLDPKHDAELIKARQTMLEAQAKCKTKMDEATAALGEAAAAEEAYSALLALKLNDPENGWRPRIWALEDSIEQRDEKLTELEALPGAKK